MRNSRYAKNPAGHPRITRDVLSFIPSAQRDLPAGADAIQFTVAGYGLSLGAGLITDRSQAESPLLAVSAAEVVLSAARPMIR